MRNPLIVPELRELLHENDLQTLKEFCEEANPISVADCLSGLEAPEIWRILMALDILLRAEIFCHFSLDQQVELVSGQNRLEMARLLEEMPPDDRADLVQRLDEQLQNEILPLVAKAEREDIRKLVSYEEGTAGAVMSTDYAELKPDLGVNEALQQLRIQAPRKETIYHAYVVNEKRQLIGFVSLKDLILARPTEKVSDLMHTDVVSVNVQTDQEQVARTIEKYDLIALPVVNGNNVLVGIVTHDDALDIIRQEQTEDIEKFMAIGGSHRVGEYLRTSAFGHFRKRAYWLAALSIVGCFSGTLMHGFENTLVSLMVLAFYLPMLADTGGNTGSQSATLVIRALALGEVSPRDFPRVLLKEFSVGLMLSVVLWGLGFTIVMLVSGVFTPGTRESLLPMGISLSQVAFAIATALAFQVISATMIGASLPLLAAKLRFDPAIVASPALTTFVDISGLLIYFTTARLLLVG